MTVTVENTHAATSLNLTASRRAVLDIVKSAGRPMKAYDILSKLQEVIKHAKPPTVYRALDYLVTNHVLHRVNNQNAFMYCQQHVESSKQQEERVSILFSCQLCGAVIENANHSLTAIIKQMTSSLGFKSDADIVECSGICQDCR